MKASLVMSLVTLLLGAALGAVATRLLSRQIEASQATCEEHGRRCEERVQELERTLLAGVDARLKQLDCRPAAPAAPDAATAQEPPREAARRIEFQGHSYDTFEVDLTRSKPRFYFRRPDGTPFGSLGSLRDWLQ